LFVFIINYKNGTTALIYASEIGHFEIVKLLIENYAEVNIQDEVFIFFVIYNYFISVFFLLYFSINID
jgi:ankyrin repeat protein